jgi:steroid 5-alpha reductase family enzyme
MARIILLLVAIAIAVFLFFQPFPFGQGLLVIMACLTALWGLSVWLKDSSIIDIFWGTGFVITVWFYRYIGGLVDTRSLVFCSIVTIWGLRLSIHLANRNIGKGEDYRYKEWRKESGKNWWWVSYFRVFLLQGILLWIISSVYVPALSSEFSDLQILDYIGIGLWAIGFIFEAVGDWQLNQFKKNRANKGKVLQTGLWSLTRHPNYFGDAVQWWGYFLFACTNEQYLYAFSPLLMTFLLMQVSGVTLLEKKLTETKPQYADYIKRVPAFFPKLF